MDTQVIKCVFMSFVYLLVFIGIYSTCKWTIFMAVIRHISKKTTAKESIFDTKRWSAFRYCHETFTVCNVAIQI